MAGTAVAVRPTPPKPVSRPATSPATPTPSPGAAVAEKAGQDAQAIGKAAPQPPRTQSRGGKRLGQGRGRSLPSPPSVSSVSPHTAVVLSMVGTAIVIVVADAVDGSLPKPRSVLGLGVVYVALAAMADLAPRIAVPFSALIFTGVLLTKGSKALSGIQTATGTVPIPHTPPRGDPGFTQMTLHARQTRQHGRK